MRFYFRHASSPRLAGLILVLLYPAVRGDEPVSRLAAVPAFDPASQPAAQPESLDRVIRVLILDGIASCQVAIEDRFDVVDVDTGARLLKNQAAARLTIRYERGQTILPELGAFLDSARIDLLPAGEKPVMVGMPKGTRRFRGRLRLVRRAPASGCLVNLVDIEHYLPGVVSAEMPASFHQEAFRAQAIAARTYAWYGKLTAGNRAFDVVATEASQVYLGMDAESLAPQGVKAVRDTTGLVCTWAAPEGRRVFCAYYSSTCGGSTQAALGPRDEPPIPPLAGGVQCEYCRNSPSYRWGPVRVDKETVTRRLRDRYAAFREMNTVESIEVLERTPEGRPTRIAVRDLLGKETRLEAENFRLALDPTGRELRSTFFTLLVEPDAVVFQDGRGFGHGLGMCQYGAQGMALAGKRAAEILSFYYPSSQITRAY